MRNGAKQTVLHCAARSGNVDLLRYLLTAWAEESSIRAVPQWGGKFDVRDRWFRTPVHWAVLNGKVEALRVLLEEGRCSADPPKPRIGVRNCLTNGAIESPMEI